MNTFVNDMISVCIPTYNGEKYLKEALDSVKMQTYKNIEVIISDDNSKDNTLSICEAFKKEMDIPVYIYTHTPQGIGANWNHCIEKSKGKYIKFLFQDDVMNNNCLEEMIKVFQEHPEIKMVVCKRNILFSENTDETKQWLINLGDLQKDLNLPDNKVNIIDKTIFKHPMFFKKTLNKIGEPTAVMFKKEIIDKIGYFDLKLKQILDFVYWYKILKHYPVAIISIPLVFFRLHNEQASFVNEKNRVIETPYFHKFIEKELFWNLNWAMKKSTIKKKMIRYKNKFKL